jgi:hypothetical protein
MRFFMSGLDEFLLDPSLGSPGIFQPIFAAVVALSNHGQGYYEPLPPGRQLKNLTNLILALTMGPITSPPRLMRVHQD